MLSQIGDGTVRTEVNGAKGAVVLLDVDSGEILALASQPTYDPNTLDADWEQLESDPDAPLLNRATQGLYQPGGALQPVVLAAALDAKATTLDAQMKDAGAEITIDGGAVGCARQQQGETLTDAVAAACPAPLAELGEKLGKSALEATFRHWGLDAPPSLEIATAAGDANVADPRLAAIGQDALTVTPLHMAMVAAAVGNGGVMSPPQLVHRTEGVDAHWQPELPQGQAAQVISPALAERLRSVFSPSADEQVLGHGSLALAGQDRPSHAWFLGLAPAQSPRYAIAVLLEHGGEDSLEYAKQIGHIALISTLDLGR
jgi:peptidoglycan glycosyltransferase